MLYMTCLHRLPMLEPYPPKIRKEKKTNIIQKVNNIAIYPLVRPFIDSDIMTPSFRSFQSTFVSIISERTRKVKNCEYPLKKKEQTALII